MAENTQTRHVTSALGDLRLANVAAIGKNRSDDLVGTAGSSAWLLDGASAHNDPEACLQHDVSWFVCQLSQALATELCESVDRDLRDVLATSIRRVNSLHAQMCSQTAKGHRASATVVIVRRHHDVLQHLVLGDSALLVQTAGGEVHHHSDTRLSAIAPHVRGAIRQALSDGRGYEDPGYRDRVNALLDAERAMRNRDDGYWIAADNPHAALHSLTGQYNLADPSAAPLRIALVSDGIKRAVTHLGLYSRWHELIENLMEPGILATISRIRHAELDDPNASRHPRSKASDDAAAITCDLGSVSRRPLA
jgi:hypothetical protein